MYYLHKKKSDNSYLTVFGLSVNQEVADFDLVVEINPDGSTSPFDVACNYIDLVARPEGSYHLIRV